MKTRREENAEATRAALILAARALFGARGYEDVAIDEVAGAARVTTGAIYHHFHGKKGLFQATAESIEAELVTRSRTVAAGTPWERLKAALKALTIVCADPAIQRILFIEAPHVIGAEAWREIELRYAYGAMRDTLAQLQASGELAPYPVDLLARTALAVLREGSAELAKAPDSKAAQADVAAYVDAVLDALTVKRS